jgi:DNA-binding MarR family transcriptional regulator
MDDRAIQMDDRGFSFVADDEASEAANLDPVSQAAGAPRDRDARSLTITPRLVLLAKHIKAIRDSREALLDASLFGEPAWNILLTLYVAAGERYALTISSLSAESGVPATTAARSIDRLLKLKMIRRVPNHSDNRSTYIELTLETIAQLSQLLESARTTYMAD